VEIKDYLKVLGKRAWLLVMIPAVAGVVAGLIAVRQPQAYRTSATLQLPRDEAATPAQIAQQVADFRAAATNPTVQSTVSERTGVPVRKIQRLKIAQVGDSSQLTLSLVDKAQDPSAAKAVVRGTAEGALDYLQSPDVDAGQRAVTAANEKIEQAQNDVLTTSKAIDDVYRNVNSSAPEDDAADLRADIRDYRRQLAQYQLEGNVVGQQQYQKLIDDAQLQLLPLLAATRQVDQLDLQLEDAQARLKTATDERDAATQQLDSVAAPVDLTFSNEAQAVVRKTRVVKTAAAAVVAGFPIAIALVLGLDALQRRRRTRPYDADAIAAGYGPPEDDEGLEPGESRPALASSSDGSRAKPEPALVVSNRAARATESRELEGNGHLVAIEPAVLIGGRAALQNGANDADDDVDDDDAPDEALTDDAFADDEEEAEEALTEDDEDEDEDELEDAPEAVGDDDTDEADEDEELTVAELVGDEEDEEAEAELVEDDDDDELTVAELSDDDEEDDADVADDEDELAEDDLVVAEVEDEVDDDAAEQEDDAFADDGFEDDDLSDEDDVDDHDDVAYVSDEAVSTNGRTRRPARVPDADQAFEEEDEGPEVDG
jgi:hypothetical protein